MLTWVTSMFRMSFDWAARQPKPAEPYTRTRGHVDLCCCACPPWDCGGFIHPEDGKTGCGKTLEQIQAEKRTQP